MKLGKWEVKDSQKFVLWLHAAGDEVMVTKDGVILSTVKLQEEKVVIKTFEGYVVVDESTHEIHIRVDDGSVV